MIEMQERERELSFPDSRNKRKYNAEQGSDTHSLERKCRGRRKFCLDNYKNFTQNMVGFQSLMESIHFPSGILKGREKDGHIKRIKYSKKSFTRNVVSL